jgi:hypothetical protein
MYARDRFSRLHRPVGPEVAAADRGARDRDDGIGRFDQAGIGDGLDADVESGVHHSRAHAKTSLIRKDAAPLRVSAALSTESCGQSRRDQELNDADHEEHERHRSRAE